MMFLGLRKLGNIGCGHKMFLNKTRNIFLCPGHKICVRNKCCARGQTGKHLCRQQCVRNNVSSSARAFRLQNSRFFANAGDRNERRSGSSVKTERENEERRLTTEDRNFRKRQLCSLAQTVHELGYHNASEYT